MHNDDMVAGPPGRGEIFHIMMVTHHMIDIKASHS